MAKRKGYGNSGRSSVSPIKGASVKWGGRKTQIPVARKLARSGEVGIANVDLFFKKFKKGRREIREMGS